MHLLENPRSVLKCPMFRPKPTAHTDLWNPHDDPMQEMLHFSPQVLEGSTKVQGCEDLNPDLRRGGGKI